MLILDNLNIRDVLMNFEITLILFENDKPMLILGENGIGNHL